MNLEFRIEQCKDKQARMQVIIDGLPVCGYDVPVHCEHQGEMIKKENYTEDTPFKIKQTESNGYSPCYFEKNKE